jgi:hypothetical protein
MQTSERWNVMAQSLNQKTVNNFVRGLITEAAELTFPEGASVDELNCDLRRDGTRRRRLALSPEVGNQAIANYFLGNDDVVSVGDWVNVGGDPNKQFLAIQIAERVYFIDKSTAPYSAQAHLDFVNLLTYEKASGKVEETKCQFTSIKGKLVISSSQMNTIVVNYVSASVLTETQISFETRDFEFQGTTSEYYETKALASTSADRKYDTKNTGWVGTKGEAALTTYLALDADSSGAADNLYPPLTHPWYAGKDSSNDFDAAEWNKVYGGTTLTGNGHYILDFFTKDRGTASGLTGLTKMTEVESSRFTTVESFSGRVFYAGLESENNSGTILFSKVIEDVGDFGICHQQNDPTSEYSSDLLATDGGVVRIPDALNIRKLYAYQSSLFVFAENGVWQITGVDGVFRATEFSVNKVTRVGIDSASSFVAAEGVPFWWSETGIHTLGTDQVSGQGQEQNISLPTIQSLWDGISSEARKRVVGQYDPVNKKIYWAYPTNTETVLNTLKRFLILDIPLQAFYPWEVERPPAVLGGGNAGTVRGGQRVVGLCYFPEYSTTDTGYNVKSNNYINDVWSDQDGPDVSMGALVVGDWYSIKTVGTSNFTAAGSADNNVGTIFQADNAGSGTGVVRKVKNVRISKEFIPNTSDPKIGVLFTYGGQRYVSVAFFSSPTFFDFDDPAASYSSFAVTGYDFIGDGLVKKNAPYIVVHSRVTEEGFTGNSTDGYESVRPSSLKVSAAWDFNETFNTSQQAYRFKYPILPNSDNLDDFNYPEDVISTRLKLLGHGRSVRIKYESEAGKDFVLLGWSIVQGRNPRY